VQDVVLAQHWVLPMRNGALPSKPPLFHWLAAGTAHLFGLSDATVRAPSACAAAAVLLVTFALGAAAGGRVTGWLAAGALLGMHGFWESAGEARVDMVFTACVTVALGAFLRWYRDRAAIARAACYLGAGLAVLAKGPAGALLPALVILVFLARERRLGLVAELWSWRLVGLVALLDLGWYALAFRAGGREFLAVQLLHENVDRFVGRGVFGLHGGRSRLSLIVDLATDLLPWNLVLPWAAVCWVRGEREDAAGRFFHTWWLVVVTFFSVAFGKRSVYLLPLYPALAVLAGRALARALARTPDDARVLGMLSVPARLKRAFPGRAALALVAILIALFDLGLAVAGQAVREHRARKASLVELTRAAAAIVPATACLRAAPDLQESDLLVVAYRMRRDIAREVALPGAGCGTPSYYLVPAETVARLEALGYRSVLTSARRKANLALVQGP